MQIPPSKEPEALRRSIGFWSGWALLAGTVIGAGIFRTPASVAIDLQNPVEILDIDMLFDGSQAILQFLASDEANFITGVLLPVDGGMSALVG